MTTRMKRSISERVDKLGSCPLCNADIAKSNLRCIGWKLNAQHIGNFFVEAMCGECRAGFELHFAKVCPDFVSFLGVAISGAGAVPPVPSHKIPPSSNNLIDIMISDRQKEAVADLSD